MRDTYGKIFPLDQLVSTIKEEKKNGARHILCHGVFDVMHSGHIFYFKAAKKYGSKLIVSITPDCHVNKGPNRPTLNQNLRLQNVAEIESVDYVILNQWPTAVELIHKLKPHAYAKGYDYQNAKDDITGNIEKEKRAIEKVGGKLVFTKEPSFSSSSLINELFPPYSESAQSFLKEFKKKYTLSDVEKYLDKLKQLKVLIIGEAIIDRYTYCIPLAKSTKDSIISTKLVDEENFLGGSLAIANHVSNFCGKTSLITNLGCEDDIGGIVSEKMNKNVYLHKIVSNDRPTIIKQRFVDRYRLFKMFEIQEMDDRPIPLVLQKKIPLLIRDLESSHDLVIVADYGHGFITSEIVHQLTQLDKFLCVNAQTNSANLGFNLITKYPRANFACIDEPEIRFATHDKFSNINELVKIVYQKSDFESIMVSLGAEGTSFFKKDLQMEHTPVFSNNVVDRTGAGDALFSLTAPLAFLNCPPKMLGLLANCAGALAVKTLCNQQPLSQLQVRKFLRALLA